MGASLTSNGFYAIASGVYGFSVRFHLVPSGLYAMPYASLYGFYGISNEIYVKYMLFSIVSMIYSLGNPLISCTFYAKSGGITN